MGETLDYSEVGEGGKKAEAGGEPVWAIKDYNKVETS